MSGHTPGPWQLDPTPEDGAIWIYNGQEGADQYAVAGTFALNPRGAADARLIAAAPELLRSAIACASAEIGWEAHSKDCRILPTCTDCHAYIRALDKAHADRDAAIAKAEGRS